MVPILRNADQMSFADIEKKIAEFGQKAKDGKLSLDELTGGTFSISNGGVFGSMLSTPIINPPQSAILGVHATKDRAVVENGQIVIRPMNYLAMSYDHRIIDGREAVLALVAMKEALEDPARLCSILDTRARRAHVGARAHASKACQGIRRRRHRRRPRRLHRRDPRRAARLHDRLHRRVEERQGRPGARRHLPQRRLHSVEGAAAVVGELRARRRITSPTTASASTDLTIDVAKMLARKEGIVVKQNNDGIVFLFKKNKITCLPRPRQVRRQGATAACEIEVSGEGETETITAKHVIVATGSNARAVCRARRSTNKILVDNDGALAHRRRAEDARRDRRGRDRPGDWARCGAVSAPT